MIDSTSNGAPDLTQLQVQSARVEERVTNLGQKFDLFAAEIKANFATRAELLVIVGQVNDLRDNQKWIVRLILGAVLLGVIGVYKLEGLPH